MLHLLRYVHDHNITRDYIIYGYNHCFELIYYIFSRPTCTSNGIYKLDEIHQTRSS